VTICSGKFVITNIAPHPKHIARLQCEKFEFHKVVHNAATCSWCVGILGFLISTLLQIYCWMRHI